ncbi:MAG TPA: cytochrome c [Amaricoccus sp.]|uniref:cytochrome c n=1 Tax=Amaricoccus sp. TaxID=1872485 RepID=UPI002BB9E2B0|nr:cytochrome c [Amaricoccus sp.]HMQ93235.1 cytochrome c [Amaricoccus sp.]HMR54252.1 cytochrome c [Amaricoccus sp.]HMR62184.1 cytochrome c [Amaricoccus sp.]HMU01244.1 cytochrome c [Amaricoccus sp.]
MRRLLAILAAAAAAGAAALWVATMPRGLPREVLAAWPEGDAGRGEAVFWAGGCESCHAAKGAKGEDRLKLGGGLVLATPFGDFVVPNISNHPEDGIGGWSAGDFADAMLRGVSPEGRHYYPAFPYASYARMEPQDIADLRAFLATLPAVEGRQPGHDLGFPFNLRRGLGLWKLAFLSDTPAVTLDAADPAVARGQYLVEGPGHCGECHTPRNLAGASDFSRWLAGAPAAEGEGRVPNITPGGDLGAWSAGDIEYYLETGFTPDFDTVGGAMVAVQENMAMLEPGERAAIAAYLQAVPAQK